jgi:hypothetical protein
VTLIYSTGVSLGPARSDLQPTSMYSYLGTPCEALPEASYILRICILFGNFLCGLTRGVLHPTSLYFYLGTSCEALLEASYFLPPCIFIWVLLVRPYQKRPTSYVLVHVLGHFQN